MATKTYDATDGVLASTDANWVGGVKPVAGDDIVFDGTAGADNCTWDLAIACGSFTMAAGYTGTVTQAASFSVTSYSQAAGIFTGSTSYTITISGNLTRTGGTFTENVADLYLTGDNAIVNVGGIGSYNLGVQPDSLNINADISIASNSYIGSKYTYIASGKTVIIASTSGLIHFVYGGTFSNLGTITGTGTMFFDNLNTNANMAFGTINCPTQINLWATSTANRVLTTQTNTIFGNTLNIFSYHSTFTVTLDLSANNYALSAASITIGERGILNGRASVISCAGTFDSSAGAFTQGTSTLIMGATGNLKCAADGVYNLRVAQGATTTLTAALNVYKNLRIMGTLTRGANTVSLLGAGEQTVSGYPDTAITVNSTGPVIFHECAHHVADVTFTAGTCVWTGYAKYVTRGNLSISAISRKPNPFTDVQNVSGTLTFDAEARMRNLTTDAGQTTVQSAGVKLGISGVVATAGTFTMNTPSKILRGMLAVPIPFPANYPVNPPSVGG